MRNLINILLIVGAGAALAFGNVFTAMACCAVYFFVAELRARSRADRAEAALARVEAVIADHPRYTARTVGAVVAKPITGEVVK